MSKLNFHLYLCKVNDGFTQRPAFLSVSSDMTQVGNGQLPTYAASVRSPVRPSGICGEQNVCESGFLQVNRLPLQIRLSPTVPFSFDHPILILPASLNNQRERNKVYASQCLSHKILIWEKDISDISYRDM